MPLSLAKTIKKNAEYKAVLGRGRSAANRHVIVYVMENGLRERRFGITASKRVGKAVARNKVRRRIREIMRLLLNDPGKAAVLPSDTVYFDIVIIARRGAVDATFKELESGLERLINKLLKEKGNPR